MKKVLLSLTLFVFFAISLNAQQPPATDTTHGWKAGGNVGLVFNQITFINWAQGGENSVSGSSFLNLFANARFDGWAWDNTLGLGYGLLTNNDKVRKTEDKIDLNSKLGHKAFDNFFWSFLVNYRSQFADGYNYPNDSVVVSKFMAPGYLIISLGLDYKLNDWLSLNISPTTGRLIFVNDSALSANGAYGVEKGKKFKPDFGWLFVATFKKEIMENVLVSSKLTLFDNYTDKDPDKRLNIVVDWELGILMKVNKYISANVSTRLLYDHNIPIPIYETINGLKTQIGTGPRTQFKEIFGVGIVYNL